MICATQVRANDTSAGVPAGSFRAEPAGAVTERSAAVTLDGEQVQVTLSVVSRRGSAILLRLPQFGWLGEGEPYPDRQFPELQVEVDGRAVVLKDSFAARASGHDVTATVQAAGVDPFAVAETPPFVEAMPDKRAAFAALVAAGAVRQAPEGTLATWSVARSVRATPGTGAHTVTMRYKARPGFALQLPGSNDVRWSDYCITSDGAAQLLARLGLRDGFLVKRYVVPVAVDGGGQRAVSLDVSQQAGAAAIVCGAKGQAVIEPTSRMAVRAGTDGAVRVLRVQRPE